MNLKPPACGAIITWDFKHFYYLFSFYMGTELFDILILCYLMSQYPVRGYVFIFISYVEKLQQKSLSDLTGMTKFRLLVLTPEAEIFSLYQTTFLNISISCWRYSIWYETLSSSCSVIGYYHETWVIQESVL